MLKVCVLLLLASIAHWAPAVDKSNFKCCNDCSFCKRHRNISPHSSPYVVRPESVTIESSSITLEIENTDNNVIFSAVLNSLADGRARLRIREKDPLRQRYEVEGALVGEPEEQPLNYDQRDDGSVTVGIENRKIVVSYKPFRVDFMIDDVAVVTLNAQGLLEFEHYREKVTRDAAPIDKQDVTPEEGEVNSEEHNNVNEEDANSVEVSQSNDKEEEVVIDAPNGDHETDEPNIAVLEPKGPEVDDVKPSPEDEKTEENEDEKTEENEDERENEEEDDDNDHHDDSASHKDDSGLWEEYFKSHYDSKPYGPSAVGMDISFPGCKYVYGIPEHADTLALKVTKDSTDPYRLYNLDVFEYELDNPMALYGSIPYMLAHSSHHTAGVFWHNAAETWVDVSSSTTGKSVLSRLMDYFKSEQDMPQIDTHWISESGIIDVFVLFGPKPRDVFRQYSNLTGPTPLPPLFALAYHQSRWNYRDQTDVEEVQSNFDKHDIPYDVLWLDIEHTDNKKIFTWDGQKFPDSVKMLNDLYHYGHRMVTIIDPHVREEENYHIHDEACSRQLFVRKSDRTRNESYSGHCWPGQSCWLDFVNPAVREWYASMFDLDKYQGSTLSLFTWNDMNEPSVFNGPEITMHKDVRHSDGYNDWEHRDVHNIYGMFQQQASSEGLVHRSDDKERPFVLSRAFFAGSQRFGAVWTGDNKAEWSHLAASMPMLMSISLAGLPFVGADVGGFFQNPSDELLKRWYQAGAYQPFFRAHAHMDTRRREPWVFCSETLNSIRESIRARYALLPYWYTEFYKTSQTGEPVMRPLWVDYPNDERTYSMQDQYLIGSDLLVKPVTSEGATSISVYLPDKNGVWYDQDDYTQYNGNQDLSLSVTIDKIPVFIRAGSIIPKKLRVRRSSEMMCNDPYTLYIALDKQGKASGLLYADDGHSFEYKTKGQFLLRSFEFSNNVLTSKSANPQGVYQSKSYIERVIILGLDSQPSSVTILEQGQSLKFTYDARKRSLIVKKPGANIGKDFSLKLS
ncbi:neutral alpha-glucosidase AB-like isoform X2 [Corticium candelabrum]|uniref:neutral alpha-glucosidase AB-like isoform X2 n=1 Tax=Corticium candelabrum TaxID=121492 RepID=UPI002E25582F|nr:neutral alpha-glucosidase AB-like isoform X2 [Corticium candelabrum]